MPKKLFLLSLIVNLFLIVFIWTIKNSKSNLTQTRNDNGLLQTNTEKQLAQVKNELKLVYKNNPELEGNTAIYCSQTTSTLPEWKTYISTASGISIKYPGYITSYKTGSVQICDAIGEEDLVDANGEKKGRLIGLAGHTLISIIPWEKSINEYVAQEDPTGVVKLERLDNATNKEAYKIIHNWDLIKDLNHRPFYQRSSIIKGSHNLILIGGGYGANPMGCQWYEEYLNDFRLKNWNIIDSITFN